MPALAPCGECALPPPPPLATPPATPFPFPRLTVTCAPRKDCSHAPVARARSFESLSPCAFVLVACACRWKFTAARTGTLRLEVALLDDPYQPDDGYDLQYPYHNHLYQPRLYSVPAGTPTFANLLEVPSPSRVRASLPAPPSPPSPPSPLLLLLLLLLLLPAACYCFCCCLLPATASAAATATATASAATRIAVPHNGPEMGVLRGGGGVDGERPLLPHRRLHRLPRRRAPPPGYVVGLRAGVPGPARSQWRHVRLAAGGHAGVQVCAALATSPPPQLTASPALMPLARPL